MESLKNKSKSLNIAFGLILLLLYGAVGYFSFGFDDEFSNIQLINEHGAGIFNFMQTIDVHPPISYYLNWVLFSLLGDWNLVRLIIGLFSAISLIYAIVAMTEMYGVKSGVFTFILLGLNPSILLWCTSLRWYSFFVPVLIWLSIVPKREGWLYWAKCFGGLLILSYIGYAALFIAIPVLYLYWMQSRQKNGQKITNILIFGFIFLLLYAYQLRIFFTVHIQNKEDQIFSLAKSVIGFFTAQVSNQGVFPISIPGAISAIGVGGLIAIIFLSNFKHNIRNNYFIAYLFAAAVTIITGLAGKFRNLVIISPWQAYWFATSKIKYKYNRFFVVFVAMITIGNLWGDINVVTRKNTTKSDYNLPVKEILSEIRSITSNKKAEVIILCHSRSLAWNLENSGYKVLDHYSNEAWSEELLDKNYPFLIVLKTWQGSMEDSLYNSMYSELNEIEYTKSSSYNLGRDNSYKIKQKLDPRYPEYSVKMIILKDVSGLKNLSSWKPSLESK